MIIKTLIEAVEYVKMNDLRNVWHQLDIINRDRTITITALKCLLDGYRDYRGGSLMDFYDFLVNDLQLKVTKITGKATRGFYVNHICAGAVLEAKCGDSNGEHKTIHRSKGGEFDNILVILEKKEDLEFLSSPNLDGNNAHRVYYMVASRAIRRLFICVPALSEENYTKLRGTLVNIPS